MRWGISMSDLALDKEYSLKSEGAKVKLIQEWLCLHGFHVAIDKEFGPATDAAVRAFQRSMGIAVDGVVGEDTFGRLIAPMMNAIRPLDRKEPLGAMVAAYAEQHLSQNPREIGGQNRGPWVRLYMDGNEGVAWPWCAGFASFILKQACSTLQIQEPIQPSFSCDLLAASASEKRCFLAESKAADKKQIAPGSLFLVRRTSADWEHTGIVISAEQDLFYTIEGNTNDEGSREGYEVCRRFRGYKNKDFIIF
jgi:hypothetical protein